MSKANAERVTPCEKGLRWLKTPQEVQWVDRFEAELRLTSLLDTRRVMTSEKAQVTLAQGKKWVLTKNEARRSNGLTVVALRDKNLGTTESDEIPQSSGLVIPSKGRFFAEVSLWHTSHSGYTEEALLSVCPMVWRGQMREDKNGQGYRVLHHVGDINSEVVRSEVALDCGCITDRIGFLSRVNLRSTQGEISKLIAKALKELYANGFSKLSKEVRQQITADTTAHKVGRTRLDDVEYQPQGGEGWNNKPLKGSDKPAFFF